MRIEFGSSRGRLRWLREYHLYLWWLRYRYGYPPPNQLCANDPIAITVRSEGPVVNNCYRKEYQVRWRYGPMYLTFWPNGDDGMANNVVIASGLSKEEAYARREQLLAIIRPRGRLL